MKLLLLSLLLTLLLSCKKSEEKTSLVIKEKNNSSLNCVYKHKYPYSEDGSEDVYIVLYNGTGYLYGSSDEFDMGREGYLPGFLKADMKEILYTDSTLSFTLEVNSDEICEKPFKYNGNPSSSVWSPGVGMEFQDQSYSGVISGDSLFLTQELTGKRLFIKM